MSMHTVTISVSPQQAVLIQQSVSTGTYASDSEVLRDALHLWEQREQMRMLEIARLKQAYDEGVASGPAVDGEQAFKAVLNKFF
jgi:antitoxin ParD1/3/4